MKLENKSFRPEPKAEVTQAAPTPTSKGKGASAANPDSMSIDDWMKWRNKQKYGRQLNTGESKQWLTQS